MSEATAQVSQTVHATAAEVWKALTTPELLERYFMGAKVKSDWKVGSPISFQGNFKGKTFEDKGEIQTFDNQRKLAFTHYSPMSGQPDAPENYHLVSFDLAPDHDATKVTLTQSNLQGGVKPSDVKMRGEFEKNWQGVLDGLKKVVEKH